MKGDSIARFRTTTQYTHLAADRKHNAVNRLDLEEPVIFWDLLKSAQAGVAKWQTHLV